MTIVECTIKPFSRPPIPQNWYRNKAYRKADEAMSGFIEGETFPFYDLPFDILLKIEKINDPWNEMLLNFDLCDAEWSANATAWRIKVRRRKMRVEWEVLHGLSIRLFDDNVWNLTYPEMVELMDHEDTRAAFHDLQNGLVLVNYPEMLDEIINGTPLKWSDMYRAITLTPLLVGENPPFLWNKKWSLEFTNSEKNVEKYKGA